MLLPRAKWQSKNNTLPLEDGQEAETEGVEREAVSNAVPSGVVVGVLDRPERLYVASFDVSVPLLGYRSAHHLFCRSLAALPMVAGVQPKCWCLPTMGRSRESESAPGKQRTSDDTGWQE